MTLVGLKEEKLNELPVMLTVQQHHAGMLGSGVGSQVHRSNVIVSTSSGGITGSMESKSLQHGCKRAKLYAQATPYSAVPHQPASVARRNARERNRVKQVNNGFATLRQHIPQSVAQALGGNTAGTGGASRAGSKKLSKVETLRMAVEYIRSLQRLLEENDGSSDSEIHHHLRQSAESSFNPPPSSEASSSPTPSFVSEASSGGGSQGYGTATGTLYAQHSDSYDNYEPMSPEDEELLDVITWWQQSQ
ncbi:achaete-scute complex protein T3-like [Neodiprion virginianus]|uniref:Achaete-scute complex protein T3-like n=1 Tax=Neodiprion lecontei TaxID=441921 RepID=A0ABM3GJ95_NEOLC|nr:achaete-scute complex protein T3-like [Neodiprion lecontei]XP_046626790.1 achaete-scute complex protein T3-like [Neodiprion virginianus]